MTAAGNDSPTAITEWAADCPQEILAALGVRRDPFTGRHRPPSTRTTCRVLARVDAEALDAAVCGYLAGHAATADPGDLGAQEIIRSEREQRRAAAHQREQQEHPRDPGEPALLPGCAGDGKVVRGAVRPDGTKVNLLAVMSHTHGTVIAQREIPAKTNEIPELADTIEYLDLIGTVVTLDALHTQVETARHLTDTKNAHYLMIVKGNQPTLHDTTAKLLTGKDTEFTATTHVSEDRGHGRRERRTVRTAPATGIDFPHAKQVLRIRRDVGELHGPWTSKEIVYGITDLPPELAGPAQLDIYARAHWGIENRTHYVRSPGVAEPGA
jgi:predicted transposase YbfD/YdcC